MVPHHHISITEGKKECTAIKKIYTHTPTTLMTIGSSASIAIIIIIIELSMNEWTYITYNNVYAHWSGYCAIAGHAEHFFGNGNCNSNDNVEPKARSYKRK